MGNLRRNICGGLASGLHASKFRGFVYSSTLHPIVYTRKKHKKNKPDEPNINSSIYMFDLNLRLLKPAYAPVCSF